MYTKLLQLNYLLYLLIKIPTKHASVNPPRMQPVNAQVYRCFFITLRAGDPSPLGRGGKPASYYSYNLSPKGGVLFYLHLHTGSLDSVVLLRSVRLSLLAYLT